MDINSVFYTQGGASAIKTQEAMANYKKYEQTVKAEEEADKTVADSYEKGEQVSDDTGIYSKENIKKTIEEIEAQREQAMQDMISEMLGKQANAAGLSFLNLNGEQKTITLSDITEAKESISDGGYWSVDSVATRIMDMAKLLANGDASKFETLKNAVIKGFGGAVEKLGYESMDEMPEITTQTYNEVMSRFDKWSEELGISSDSTETEE